MPQLNVSFDKADRSKDINVGYDEKIAFISNWHNAYEFHGLGCLSLYTDGKGYYNSKILTVLSNTVYSPL